MHGVHPVVNAYVTGLSSVTAATASKFVTNQANTNRGETWLFVSNRAVSLEFLTMTLLPGFDCYSFGCSASTGVLA